MICLLGRPRPHHGGGDESVPGVSTGLLGVVVLLRVDSVVAVETAAGTVSAACGISVPGPGEAPGLRLPSGGGAVAAAVRRGRVALVCVEATGCAAADDVCPLSGVGGVCGVTAAVAGAATRGRAAVTCPGVPAESSTVVTETEDETKELRGTNRNKM